MKNETIRYTVAANIKRVMASTPDVISEIELAVRSHLRPSAVRGILLGLIDVDVDMIAAIAGALSVDASALLADPRLPIDPLELYRSRIAALPADQQRRIQAYLNSVSATHEETAIH